MVKIINLICIHRKRKRRECIRSHKIYQSFKINAGAEREMYIKTVELLNVNDSILMF